MREKLPALGLAASLLLGGGAIWMGIKTHENSVEATDAITAFVREYDARSCADLLIEGPSGTGKDFVNNYAKFCSPLPDEAETEIFKLVETQRVAGSWESMTAVPTGLSIMGICASVAVIAERRRNQPIFSRN